MDPPAINRRGNTVAYSELVEQRAIGETELVLLTKCMMVAVSSSKCMFIFDSSQYVGESQYILKSTPVLT